jgi:hypothetical protein
MANSLRVQATNEIMQITAVVQLIQQTDRNMVFQLNPNFNNSFVKRHA